MDPAVAALIGALGGVAITTAAQVYLEWQRGRREAQAARAHDKRALRLAARLVMEELADAQALVAEAGESRRYWVAPRNLSTDVWNTYRTDIAAAIDSPLDWRLITSAYDAINNLNWLVQHRRNTAQEIDIGVNGARVQPTDNTRDVWRTIRGAIEALEGSIGVQGPASRLLADQSDQEREHWPFGDGDDFDLQAARVWQSEQVEQQQRPFR